MLTSPSQAHRQVSPTSNHSLVFPRVYLWSFPIDVVNAIRRAARSAPGGCRATFSRDDSGHEWAAVGWAWRADETPWDMWDPVLVGWHGRQQEVTCALTGRSLLTSDNPQAIEQAIKKHLVKHRRTRTTGGPLYIAGVTGNGRRLAFRRAIRALYEI